MNSTLQNGCTFLPTGQITPEILNTDVLRYTSIITLTIILFSLPICTIGNALVILVIATTPSLQVPANIFIGSLALADFLIGTILHPFASFLILNREALLNCDYMDSFIKTVGILAGCSMKSMALVSCERYIALFFPLRYPTFINNTRAAATCFSAWIILMINSLMAVYFPMITQPIWILFYLISCFVIGIAYYKILLLVRHHQQQIQTQQIAMSIQNATLRKQSVTVGYAIGISMICYIPISIITLLFLCIEQHSAEILACVMLSFAIQFMSSGINPIVYCLKREDFRKACIAMLRKWYH